MDGDYMEKHPHAEKMYGEQMMPAWLTYANPNDDPPPESLPMAKVFYTAVSISVIACIAFAVVIVYNKLLRTPLMKQVLCLCLSDILVYTWELAWCPSLLSMYPHCLNTMTCQMFYPMLRTLQMASVLWTTQIAVGVALVVSARSTRHCGRFGLFTPFVAVLLCSWAWIAGMTDGYEVVSADGYNVCQSTWSIHPDTIWSIEVLILLLVIVSAYIHTVWHIWKLSTAAAVTAKLYRVMIYVAVFGCCYAPYVILQGLTNSVDLAKLARTSPFYQSVYILYLLAGACNVAAYGIHHWDGACWRRRRRRRNSAAGNEVRVVTFLPNARVDMSRSATSSGASSGVMDDSVLHPECEAREAANTESTSLGLGSTMEDPMDSISGDAMACADTIDALLTQTVMDAAEAYGCI